MIAGLTMILLCQLAGEILARLTGLPTPGPVVGMVLLLLVLIARDGWRRHAGRPVGGGTIETVGGAILANLSVLFIPAAVGVVVRLDVLAQYGLALAVALVASTLVSLLVTVGTFVAVARWTGSGAVEP